MSNNGHPNVHTYVRGMWDTKLKFMNFLYLPHLCHKKGTQIIDAQPQAKRADKKKLYSIAMCVSHYM